MAVRGISCFVSSCSTNHFGMNPVIGGKPPKDSMVIIVMAVRIGAFVQLVPNVLIFVAAMVFSAMKAVEVIMM